MALRDLSYIWYNDNDVQISLPMSPSSRERGTLFLPGGWREETTVWEQLANRSESGTFPPLPNSLGKSANDLPPNLKGYPSASPFQRRSGSVWVPQSYLDSPARIDGVDIRALYDKVIFASLFGSPSPPKALPEKPKRPPQLPKATRTTPAIGFRRWRLLFEKGEISLRPVSDSHHDWKIGQPSRAVCHCFPKKRSGRRSHPYPTRDSNCGFWFYKTPEAAIPYDDDDDEVFGAVVAWGKIIEGETGFRAQWAQPIALTYNQEGLWLGDFKTRAITEAVGRATDLPVVPMNEIRHWMKEFGDELDSCGEVA